MRRFTIPASVAIALAAAGCSWSSADAEERDAGAKVSRNYQVGDFSKIAVAGPYEVKVVTGGQAGVSASGGEKLLDETEVVVDGDTLEIRPKKRKGFRWNWSNGSAEFTVNVAALRAAAIAGSGGITVDKVAGDFEGDVAGSGDLRLPAIAGGKIKLAIAGSGGVRPRARPTASTSSSPGRATSTPRAWSAAPPTCRSPDRAMSPRMRRETADVSIMGSGDVDIIGRGQVQGVQGRIGQRPLQLSPLATC